MDIKKNIKYQSLLKLVLPLALIVFWQIASKFKWLNPSIMPSPLRILQAFIFNIKSGLVFEHLAASLRRVAIGFLSGVLAGIVVGFFVGFYKLLDNLLNGLLNFMRSIPTVGLIPLFILWFGIGEESKIIVIAISTFWSVLVNTQQGLMSTDKKLIEVAQILEKDQRTIFFKIILPSSLPAIISGIRLGLSAAWKAVVTAEMIASIRGIGYMISYARELSQPDVLFVGLIIIGLIGLFLDFVLIKIQKKIIKWA